MAAQPNDLVGVLQSQKDGDSVITRVWLDESKEDCTMCGLCQNNCPEVFVVPERMTVRDDADLTQIEKIRQAAKDCPVSVIAFELNHSGQRDNQDD